MLDMTKDFHAADGSESLFEQIGMTAALASIYFREYQSSDFYIVQNAGVFHYLFSESDDDFDCDLSTAVQFDGLLATVSRFEVRNDTAFEYAMAFDVVEKTVADRIERGFDKEEMQAAGMKALELCESVLKFSDNIDVQMIDGKLVFSSI